MTSREEKILAAKRKLREFQIKNKDSDGLTASCGRSSTATSSPSPTLAAVAAETPSDLTRLAYERRQTLEMNVSPLEEKSSHSVSPAEKYKQELDILRNQLARQNQAMTLLVAERNEAQTQLSHIQSELQQKSDMVEEIKAKFCEANRRVYELENASPRPTTSVMVSQVEDELRGAQELAAQKISFLEERLSEFQSRLEGKTAECQFLTEKVTSLTNALSIAQVQVQQLSLGEPAGTDSRLKGLEDSNVALKQQVELLERRLQAAAMEGDQAAHRFQIYADQCNAQQIALQNQVRELSDSHRILENEKYSYSRRIEELTAEIERLRNEKKRVKQGEDVSKLFRESRHKDSQIAFLRKQLEEVGNEKKSLEEQLFQASEKLKLQDKATETRPDSALLAAIESDKIAASRAVSQNRQLKFQLAELQDAIIKLNNEKLKLSDELARTLHENSELKKQATDHHDHDHSDCHDHDHGEKDDLLDMDIDTLRRLVTALRSDKAELIKRQQKIQHSDVHSHGHSHHHHDHSHGECDEHAGSEKESHETQEEIMELRRAVKQLQDDKTQLLERLGSPIEDPETQGLLEVKLRRTMDEIASLDEEKQRLEHLVFQLQGETETIGEYIALYHKQRLLLKQRSLEKDEQLVQLSKDREELREKLKSLNDLVSKLVTEKPNEIQVLPDGIAQETADKIQKLITEIGNSNVVSSHSLAFEQCSCCSGRLIVV